MGGTLACMAVDRGAATPNAPANGPELDEAADAASRRRARKWWWATGIVVVLITVYVLTTGGESASSKVTLPRDFCRATARYEEEVERQVEEGGNRFTQREVERQVARVEEIVATAPRKIRADAEKFLTAMQRVEANPSSRNRGAGPKIKTTVDNVTRFANQGCGVYAREGL
jgi:hypothetical protein